MCLFCGQKHLPKFHRLGFQRPISLGICRRVGADADGVLGKWAQKSYSNVCFLPVPTSNKDKRKD